MFTSGPNYNKLKTNLRLSINRLKLLGKKKTEQAQKARKEIADYIGQGKVDRARIRVEHIIREDYLVEALEMIELFCDLLVARFGLLETSKAMDPGLEECIATLIYCAPRLQSDIQELKIVSDQLTLKFKKEYAEDCRANRRNVVNEKVVLRLAATPPPKILVERYLVEIARSHNVPFEPDAQVMVEDEIALAEDQLGELINFGGLDPKNPNAVVPNSGFLPDAVTSPAYPPAPGLPFNGPGGGLAAGGLPYPPSPSHPQPPDAALYPPPATGFGAPDLGPGYPPNNAGGYPGPGASMPPSYNDTMKTDHESPNAPPLPSKGPAGGPPAGPGLLQPPSNINLPEIPGDGLPNIPSPPRSGGVTPSGGPGGAFGGNDDVDLDDLTRRFEELKKRK